MTQHAYDNPNLDDRQWLQAVRNDPTVPMSLRLDAARVLLRTFGTTASPSTSRVDLVYHITPNPGLDLPPTPPGIDPAEFQRDMTYIQRCWELGIMPCHLEDIETQGTA
jgi:hypothetical protein